MVSEGTKQFIVARKIRKIKSVTLKNRNTLKLRHVRAKQSQMRYRSQMFSNSILEFL